ncbi:DNA-binding transcriptional regulator, LysR family [Nocardioides lianchengensis]|uniref:DNA-binding transcriptional regulator, LysR family n=2 Tax=Nocardioides lianchengensis TaxID=1045774 RepID=A0A1G6ZYP4_9ACTN|nr:DNA-binding transcriptional regulator, LysR family [Nocardioides lianchengensis]
MDMDRSLDIGPLRSLVAVADCGGFQRAAERLHLSQAGVSQHVRRLEAAVGRPLVERHGRGSRFTADGERLLDRARQILELHDETLRGFVLGAQQDVLIGSTEHAAAHLLPTLSAALERASDYRFRYRIDRGTQLREGLAAGQVDLALLLNVVDDPRAVHVGELELTWYAAPGWRVPTAPDPVPVVAFSSPCELRKRALGTLAEHGVPAEIGAEATQLAGVQAAVGAGLGVALMATMGETPAGLVPCDALPVAEPLALYVCPRADLADEVVQVAVDTIRLLLSGPRLALAQ